MAVRIHTIGAVQEKNGVCYPQNGNQSHIHLENIVVLGLFELVAIRASFCQSHGDGLFDCHLILVALCRRLSHRVQIGNNRRCTPNFNGALRPSDVGSTLAG
jgi:hypothetical protein